MKVSISANFLILFLIMFKLGSCQQISSIGPGYKFELFSNSPVHELAKAVEIQDTTRIIKFVVKDSIPIDFKEPKFGQTLLTLAILNEKNLFYFHLQKYSKMNQKR